MPQAVNDHAVPALRQIVPQHKKLVFSEKQLPGCNSGICNVLQISPGSFSIYIEKTLSDTDPVPRQGHNPFHQVPLYALFFHRHHIPVSVLSRMSVQDQELAAVVGGLHGIPLQQHDLPEKS